MSTEPETAKLAGVLESEYGISKDTLEQDPAELIAGLVEHKLLVVEF